MNLLLLILLVCCSVLTGCQRLTKNPPVRPIEATVLSNNYSLDTAPLRYHIVSKGETLWRICKNYGVSVSEVIKLNHIEDPNSIKVGQKIYLPTQPYVNNSILQVSRSRYYGKSEDFFHWPVRGKIVLFYGQCREGWVNKGIEIKTKDKFARAPKSGKIVFCGKHLKGYGSTVMIDHGNGFISVISANADILKGLGDFVKQGDPILRLKSQKSVVHFEIRKNTKPVNPLKFLK